MSRLRPGSTASRQVSNPLPSLADLTVNDRTPQQLLYAAAAARAAATPAQLEAQGIRPDDEEIVASMSRDPRDLINTNRGLSTGYKVYKPTRYSEFLESNRARYEIKRQWDDDGEFRKEFFDALVDLGLEDVDLSTQQQFLELAHTNTRKIEAAAQDWNDLHLPGTSTLASPSKFDLIGSLATSVDILVEVGKHLDPRDIISLYSISRDFHATLNSQLQSCVISWVRIHSLEGARLYTANIYHEFFIRDPTGRPRDHAAYDMSYITQPEKALQPVTDMVPRHVPGLRWLQLVANRARRTRDILAVLARHGHRTPPGTQTMLLKLWLSMDLATSEARLKFFRRPEIISDKDLALAQLFFVKLHLLFNDPVLGPSSTTLLKVLLGQRSLSTLWAFLRRKKYTTRSEVLALKVHYDIGPSPEQVHEGYPVQGVPIHEMGVGHLEAWGLGSNHLMRPDECVTLETVRRQLELSKFIRQMMTYGHVDPDTGATLVPTLQELYMSDDDLPEYLYYEPLRNGEVLGGGGNVPFERRNWTPKDVRKAGWNQLSREEKEMILDEEWREISHDWGVDSADKKLQVSLKKLERALLRYTGDDGRVAYRRTRLPLGLVEGTDEQDGKITGTSNHDEEREGEAMAIDDASSPAGPVDQTVPPELGAHEYQSPGHTMELTLIQHVSEDQGEEAFADEEAEEAGHDDEAAGEEVDEAAGGSRGEYYEGYHGEGWDGGNSEDDEKDEKGQDDSNEDDGEANFDSSSEAFETPASDPATTPPTLDDYLLTMGDQEYAEEEFEFDWAGHLRDLAVENAPGEGSDAFFDFFNGHEGHQDGEEDEDERVTILRNYYRQW